MKININGDVYEGHPIDIVEQMSEHAFHSCDSLDEYITLMCQNIWKFNHIGIHVQAQTLEERALSFIDQLLEHGLAKVEKD